MSLPTDAQIVRQVHAIIVDAYETNTIAEHTKRKVRGMLSDHFGVDLEPKKKLINQMTMDQVNLVSAIRAQQAQHHKALTFKSYRPKKSAKKQPKRSRSEDEDDGAGGSDGGSGSSTVEAEVDFSELEDDTPVQQSRSKPSPSTSASIAKSASKLKKSAGGRNTSGGKEEQRLTRLKKLVLECGVRKPWKKLYEAASVSESDFSGQCRVVQDVLNELGMTGKGSLEQARKIRDQREFANELAALEENEIINDSGRATRTRASLSGATSAGKTVSISADDELDASSVFEQQAESNRSSTMARPSSSRAKHALSDSDDSHDDGPTRRKSFKSSLASFAADLNSDSD